MILHENTFNKNKNVSANVKYLSENTYNVTINGVCEGIDVDFQNVKAELNGTNDIELDIACHSIFKAKFYSNTDGNIRVLKRDGSITSIVRMIFLFYFILFN